MAVAGGGVPAVRVYIYQRQLRRSGYAHNVDALVVLTPEQAALRVALGESVYVESVGEHERKLQDILEDMGFVDEMHTAAQWLAWAMGAA